MKAVIPVAGLGMHMLPATKAIPKEMLPIVDRPVIEFIVNECNRAGIKEIIFVTHSSKSMVGNHFDTSFELEALLEERLKRQLLAEVQAICPEGVTIMSVRQGQPLGLGHAVLCARSLIGNAPFAVVLPDILLDESTADQEKDNLAALVARFNQTGHSQVLVQPRAETELSDYSVVVCERELKKAGDAEAIKSLVEKPDNPHELHSDLAAVGRYVLSADIWPLLEKTQPGAWGRIQLTDAISALVQEQPVDAIRLTGRSFDCGRKLGYMQAFVAYGLRHKGQGKAFRTLLEQLVK